MKWDVLCVGAGLTSAVVCAQLKRRYRCLVMDCRPYMGGNCADYPSGSTFVHLHGPHNYHAPHNHRSTHFLSKYTRWAPFHYTVTAEIEDRGTVKRVPFPYGPKTEMALGRSLSDQEIIDLFFRGYSQKMWGQPWEKLPKSVRSRVIKRDETTPNPCYFKDHFEATPMHGYSVMFRKMFEGVDLILGVDRNEWKEINAERVVYCGRIEDVLGDNPLPYRSILIHFNDGEWSFPTTALNVCHQRRQCHRVVNYGAYGGDGNCRVQSFEYSIVTQPDDPTPYYPIPSQKNCDEYEKIKYDVMSRFPNLIPAGRLGTYRYLDMWQTVEEALDIAEQIRLHFERQ